MSSSPSFIIVGLNYAPEPTGNAPYTTDLARHLSEEESVRVITGIPHYPWWTKQKGYDDAERLASSPRLQITRLNHFVPKRQGNLGRFFMEISFGLNVFFRGDTKGKVLILVSPAMLSSALVLLKIRLTKNRAQSVVWVQDLYEQGLKEIGGNSGVGSRVIARVENWLLDSASQVVFAHKSFESAKSNLLGSKSNVESIPNWTQFVYKPNQGAEEVRQKYGFKNGRVILHIGNMGLKQGLENVVQAASLASANNDSVQFVMVGGGNQIEYLKSLAGACENIVFIPPVSEGELSDIINSADILLVNEKPGIREMSMPSKLTTYFQSGIPTIVCSEPDSVAAKEVVDNQIGYWVQSGVPELLLGKVRDLDLSEARSVAGRAKIYSENNLSGASSLRKFSSILQDLKTKGSKN